MVFSFFKKQPNKMPERPSARPRPVEPPPEAKPVDTVAEAPPKVPAAPLAGSGILDGQTGQSTAGDGHAKVVCCRSCCRATGRGR